jgi:hypothetical protein
MPVAKAGQAKAASPAREPRLSGAKQSANAKRNAEKLAAQKRAAEKSERKPVAQATHKPK